MNQQWNQITRLKSVKKKSVDNSKVLTKFLPTSVFIYKFNFHLDNFYNFIVNL